MTNPRTFTELSRVLGVSARTISAWAQREDWPAPLRDGSFSLPRIRRFLKTNRLGQHNPRRVTDRPTLTAAKIELASEQAESLKVRNQRLRHTQRRELGDITTTEDATDAFSKMKAAVMDEVRQLKNQIVELVDRPPRNDREWKARRQNILDQAASINPKLFQRVQRALASSPNEKDPQ